MERVTDQERREVVSRLREYVDLPDDWWQETRAEFYVEKCVFGNVDRHSEAELFARLADLIEPSCDRDALLALAEKMEGNTWYESSFDEWMATRFAHRIREACGA